MHFRICASISRPAVVCTVLGLVVNASLWLLWIGFGYHSTRQDVR